MVSEYQKEPITKEQQPISWVSPTVDWTKQTIHHLIGSNGWHRNEANLQTDIKNLTNEEIVTLFQEKNLYIHISTKDSTELYYLLIQKLDIESIKKISQNQNFIQQLEETDNGREFLWNLFEQSKMKQTWFSPYYQNTLIRLDYTRYMDNLSQNIELLSKITWVTWEFVKTKGLLENKDNTELYSKINISEILQHIVKNDIDIKDMIHLLNCLSNNKDIEDELKNEINKLNPEKIKELFWNKMFLQFIKTKWHIESLKSIYDSIKDTTWFPTLKKIFDTKKED